MTRELTAVPARGADRNTVTEHDLRYLWHPWSPVGHTKLGLSHGDGYRVWDLDGRSYLDATAGAANLSCGYAHPRLLETVTRQLGKLPHFDMAAGTHEPAALLAEQLANLLPSDLERTFFVNSGSEAAEAAIRIALDYWRNIGEPRSRVVSFAAGYHGSTLLAQSLSGLSITAHGFGEAVQVNRVELPKPASELRDAGALSILLTAFTDAFAAADTSPAAVVVEPLLNVGGGVVLPQGFLRGLRRLCDTTGTLMIADEVFTGFGRTGRMFGFDHDSAAPDIVMLGKGLASGYIPLSAVSTTNRIYEAFRADPVFGGLRYGHTTSGHATACAVGMATIDVIRQEQLVSRAARLGNRILDELSDLHAYGVEDVRGLGLVTALEMATDTLADRVIATARQSGLLLRRQGRVVMAVPPLIIDEPGTDEMIHLLRQAVIAVAGKTINRP